MDETMSVTKARARLLPLVDEVAEFGKVVTITKSGVAKAVLVAKDELESLYETVVVMSDRKLVRELKEALKEADTDEGIPLEQIRKKYNL
jgi:antitoxin YefM